VEGLDAGRSARLGAPCTLAHAAHAPRYPASSICNAGGR